MLGSSSAIDVVLVNPGNRTQVYQKLGTELAAIETPVWAGLIAQFLRGKQLSVDIIDANALGLGPEETAQRVDEMDPLLTVVVVYGHQPSASTQNMPAAGAVASAIKRVAPQRRVAMVGGHAAALPARTLAEEDIDFVSGGEGLHTILDLVELLKAGPSAVPSGYEQVRDLWYRDADGRPIASRAAAPLFDVLDAEMPGMAYDLLPMDRYRAHNWHCFGDLDRERYASMYTTLGCPYHCSFCCIQAPFKSGEGASGLKMSVNSYRFWSPDTVIAKIDELVNQYGVRNIKMADEMFVLNRKHISDICDRIIERRYDLNIWAYARIDTVKDGMAEKLKAAGFNWLAFGIESASERVQASVAKRFNEEQVFETVTDVRTAGINVIGNYIFGLPEDDQESMQATLDLATDLNCEFANFYVAMAYPGSELYTDALREGWELPDDWSGYSQHAVNTRGLPTKYLGSGEVIRFRDDAFHAYFSNPRYLDMITRKFGQETADHIRAMTSQRLERQYAS